MTILTFLEDNSPDNLGRLLSDIWIFDDQRIEMIHDFIQWLFPLNEPSGANFNAPVLSESDINNIRKSLDAKNNLSKSADWYLKFLSRNSHWICPHDHNHLRITRVIKSLRLLCSDEKADGFKQSVLEIAAKGEQKIGAIALKHWAQA